MDPGQCLSLHTGRLGDNAIGDGGAQDLGAALQVNMILTTLTQGWGCGSWTRVKMMCVIRVTIAQSSLPGHAYIAFICT